MECPVHDDRLTLMGLLVEAHAGLTTTLERRLEAESGLSGQWFEVLLRLARSPDHRLRMSDLASQVTLTPSGLTRAVDRLEAEGLVKRESCPSDRRGSNAVLTAKGVKRLEAAVPKHLDHLDELIVDILTAKERAALEGALRKVRDALRPESVAGAGAGARD
jgi:DNA-binding MarR family transcriptional regulator